jgi:hypothetical protein
VGSQDIEYDDEIFKKDFIAPPNQEKKVEEKVIKI